MAQHTVRNAVELKIACAGAAEGDVILVHGGIYDAPATLRSKRRIVVAAADQGWISGGKSPDPLWGGGTPASDSPHKPDITDFAFLIVDKCADVTIDGLKIRDCWPSIFFVKDTTRLTVRNCALRHATYAIFAKGETTSHLLIERNEWQQDDSAGHALWSRIDWRESHGDEGSNGQFRYFNGGFLSTKRIRGNVVVRGNTIKDCYNAVRMKADDAPPPDDQMARINADVHIFDNDFIRIRDNPIEPEVAAYNWHVRHNRLRDCHAWFSCDGVAGGFWYFYGNTGRFESRQGPENTFGHTMGRVLKLSYQIDPADPNSERVPTLPWFVFNNSWHLRCPVIGGANPTVPPGGEGPDFTARLAFFNNAFVWCDPGRYGPWVCEWISLTRNLDIARSADTRFDHDICDRADFLDFFRRAGRGEDSGVLATRPIFADAAAGDFTLARDSEARGNGWLGTIATPTGDVRPRTAPDGTLDRGAAQEYGLIQVPDLEAQATALLAEMGVSA